MAIRVMLYAEGPAEDRGPLTWLPEPGEPLLPEMLGPAHHLFSRLLQREHMQPDIEVRYLSPLRVKTGRPHRGSDLVTRKVVRQLLTIADPKRRPDLGVVLVDEDGTGDRRRDLLADLAQIEQPHVVAVPVREFEAWLVSDPKALSQHLAVAQTPPAAESMKPREAKDMLRGWIEARMEAGSGQAARAAFVEQIRSALAQQVDLEVLDKLRAFKHLRDDLRTVLRTLLAS